MKRNVKSKLILCIILAASALTGIAFNEFSGKYAENNYNSKSDVISELRDTSGDWEPQITHAVGDTPYDVFIGDVNNDGYNDIVTANVNPDMVSILLWNSTSGDLDPQITRTVGDSPRSVFIGDVNNDGYNDIATANYLSDTVSILLWNSTSGDWDPQITRAVGGYPYSVFIGDANNDGHNDIATANVISDTVSILLWNSTSGDLDSQISRAVGVAPRSVFIGDINNDTYNDIVTANAGSNSVSILLWNSTSGDLDPQITRDVGNVPISIFIGDVNNDGYNDIATANYPSDTVSILLWNSTSGDLDPQITRIVGDGPCSIFIEDANNDDYNDIAIANDASDMVSILLWNSTLGDLDPQITCAVGDSPYSVFIGDVNNDGYNDIATANYLSDTVSILLSKPPPIISIISPKNIIYKEPMSGYYPATYGFENDLDGSIPSGWLDLSAGSATTTVDEEKFNHKKVLKAYDPGSGSWINTNITFSPQISGAIEFWVLKESGGDGSPCDFNLRGDNQSAGYSDAVRLLIDDSNWGNTFYSAGYGYFAVENYSDDQWFHIRIDFNCSSDKYDLYLDGLKVIDQANFYYSENYLDHIWFASSNGRSGTYYVDAISFSWDPNYNIGDNFYEGLLLSYENNTTLDWQGYSLDGQANVTISGNTTLAMPGDGIHSIQVFGRDTESGQIIESKIRYFTVDTINPEIIIESPIAGESFGFISPKYNISIIEPHLETIWYTIDGGINNFTIDQLSGFIDSHAWIDAPFGSITLRFYAKDTVNHTNYEEVVITKTKFLSVEIINLSFSLSEFTVEFFVYNESREVIDFASIQLWWDGTDVSSGVQNLGNGLYFVSLEPITVAPGEDPILLNMTISASGYEDTYFETYIAVEPPEIVTYLQVEIVEHSYSLEHFNFTFFVCDEVGQGIEFATIQLWWDGTDVSSGVQNLGNGLYFVSLEPITVAPGEDPILLNMTISASGYEDKYFEAYIGVDPDTLQKGIREPSEEFPLLLIVTISVVSVGVIVGATGIYWLKKRKRKEI